MNSLTLRINKSANRPSKAAALWVSSFSFPAEIVEILSEENVAFKNFFTSSSADEQLSNLRVIIKNSDYKEVTVIDFFVTVFLEAPSKHPVKCFIARHITKTEALHQQFSKQLSEKLTILIHNHVSNWKQFAVLVTKISSTVENFPPGVVAVLMIENEVVDYLKTGLGCCIDTLRAQEVSPLKKNEIFNLCHLILRILLNLVQKYQTPGLNILEKHLPDIRCSCKWLLLDMEVPMDTKSVSAILLLSLHILGNKEDSWTDILEKRTSSFNEILDNEAAELAVYSAIATVVSPITLENTRIGESAAIMVLINHVLRLGDSTSSDSTLTLAVSRTIHLISKYLGRIQDHSVGESILDSLLPFIWAHLEHHMDSVRHLSGQTLNHAIKYCAELEKKGFPPCIPCLVRSVCGQRSVRALSSLSCALAEHAPSEAILLLPKLIELSDYSVLSSCIKTLSPRLPVNSALSLIAPLLDRCISHVDSIALQHCEEVLTLLANNFNIAECLIPEITSSPQNSEEVRRSLICARVLKHCGEEKLIDNGTLILLLRRAAVDSQEENRILALSLVVESNKSTEMYSEDDLNFILHYLQYNINAQSPNFRQLTLALMKKFVKRLDDSYKSFRKQRVTSGSEEDYYIKFLEDLRDFCFDSLLKGANYSRRVVALQILRWCETIDMDGYKKIWKDDYVDKLLFHLDDSYENNKQLALDILKACPTELLEGKIYSTSIKIECILKQASSLKPTDCTSAAFKFKLLNEKLPHSIQTTNKSDTPESASFALLTLLLTKLKQELHIAEESILKAASEGPMYGVLHCMCRLMKDVNAFQIAPDENWRLLCKDIIATCMSVCDVAGQVVNNSSPEGHLPMDHQEARIGDSGVKLLNGKQVTAQMVLLCAWRSVKEVSLLLGEMSSRLRIIGEDDFGSISVQDIKTIGHFLRTLLLETQHRGAFEQAYVGFTMLATRLWQCNQPELHSLPSCWLRQLLEGVGTGEGNSTRRSAGLPFVMQALVTTELQVNGNPKCFNQCMSTLLSLARFDSSVPFTPVACESRTHSLNILRALYRNTTLGDAAGPYVAEGFMVAIDGFDASTWQERNSSTLLLSALIVRVFGVSRVRKRSGMTGRVFFVRFPALYDYLLNVVKSAAEKSSLQPRLVPALLLLSQLRPSALDGTESHLKLSSFVPWIIKNAGSPILLTRGLVAASAPPLHPAPLLLCAGWRGMRPDANSLHGNVLLMLKLLEVGADQGHDPKPISSLLPDTIWILHLVLKETPCYLLIGDYIKVVNMVLWRYASVCTEEVINEVMLYLNKLLFEIKPPKISPGKDIAMSNAMYLLLIINIKKSITNLAMLINNGLQHYSYEVVLATLNYLLILYETPDKENSNQFLEHLQEFSSEKNLILEQLRNNKNYLNNLSYILQNNKYMECIQKVLKVTSLENNTHTLILGINENSSHDDVIEKFIHCVENKHENLTHIYLHSLLKFVSKNLKTLSQKRLMDVIRTTHNYCTSENNYDVRETVVSFLERSFDELFELQLSLNEACRFELTSTILSTTIILLEDDEDEIRQRIADIITKSSVITHKVVPSKAADVLFDKLSKFTLNDKIAMFIIIGLLDFKSEVMMTDDRDEECRVFDQNERHNIFLEESVWSRRCALHIRNLCKDAKTTVKNILTCGAYKNTIVNLCTYNLVVFERLLYKSCIKISDVENPKIELFFKCLE